MTLPCGCEITLECHSCCGAPNGCEDPVTHITKRSVSYSVKAYCRWHKGGLNRQRPGKLTLQILAGNAPVTTRPEHEQKKEVKTRW